MTNMIEQYFYNINTASSSETNQSLEFLMEAIKKQIGADRVTWAALYKGDYGHNMWHAKAMDNWKVMDVIKDRSDSFDVKKATQRYYQKIKSEGEVEPVAQKAVDTVGRSRAFSTKDTIEHSDHWMNRMLDSYGVSDRLIAALSLSKSCESHFWIDRVKGKESFSERDQEKALHLLWQVPRLHFWMFLQRGLISPATKPLSPREQETLHYLLGDKDETKIANAMGIARGTVHNYISEIYQIFNVRSRYELTSIWLQAPTFDTASTQFQPIEPS